MAVSHGSDASLKLLDDALGSLDRGKDGDLTIDGNDWSGGPGRDCLIREPRRTYLAGSRAHSLGQSPDRSAQRRELRDYGVVRMCSTLVSPK